MKVKIQDQTRFAKSDQIRLIDHLSSEPREVYDHETLAELNIHEGAVLIVVLRLAGG